MARLTITLPDDTHRALRLAASRRRVSISQLIDESLATYGIGARSIAATLVARARAGASLSPSDAMGLAIEETRAVRRRETESS